MTHHIVVLGAGYAGLAAAKRLAHLMRGNDVRVTLVNRDDRFVERVRLHQLAAGQDLHEWRLSQLLSGSEVELVVATVTGIEPEARAVQLDTAPHTLGYDILVYALGSSADLAGVPGVREHAHTVAGAQQALEVRTRLPTVDRGGRVVVVGGGLTGIETAAEVAESRPDLHVVLVSTDTVGGWLSQRAQRHLQQALAGLGVTVREGLRVAAVHANTLVTDGGQDLHNDAIIWAAGFAVPPVAADAGFAVDARGRMVVDDRLRSISHPQVYGVGDAAAAPTPGGTETRMSCQTGLPMGQYAAKAITRTLAGHEPAPIRIRYVWQNISLGRHDGITQFTRFNDEPVPFVLTGRAAARFKELITRGAAWAARR